MLLIVFSFNKTTGDAMNSQKHAMQTKVIQNDITHMFVLSYRTFFLTFFWENILLFLTLKEYEVSRAKSFIKIYKLFLATLST